SKPAKTLDDSEKLALRRELGFGEDSLVMLGSSTWRGEEEMLLSALDKIRAEKIDCRLLLVPRHAERREQIKRLIEAYPHCVRSVSPRAERGTLVYLADTTGELRMLTQAADFALVGKSLPPNVGGQTPIDCAALGVPIVYGPKMANFRRACETLERENAVIKVPDADAAKDALLRLAKDARLRADLASRAKKWHESNRGAAERSREVLSRFL
ncbi:MAG: 3-deoxy-D-manno-octulosonic acid transferase, partial [Opitutales bacterium]|nr:3-deoxy-D-manno-octulosonic acid transferase [Opitutales bacterium]